MLRSDYNFNKTHIKDINHSSSNSIFKEKEEYAYYINTFQEEVGRKRVSILKNQKEHI